MQRALVAGWGKSGQGSAKLLERSGWQVSVYDDAQIDCAPYEQATGTDYTAILQGTDLVVVNPAIAYDHPLLETARRCNIGVIGELELAFRMKKGDLVAITGTNGKTTTTTLLCKILCEAGIDAHAVGNIGTSYCSELADKHIDENSVAVVEVSSFQLETVQSFKPSFAILLNITPDHFERHGSLNRYAMTKYRIFTNQTARDYAILNYDDPICRSFMDSVAGRLCLFSTKQRVRGAYVYEGNIYYDMGTRECVCSVDDVSLTGEYNLSNVLACVIVAKRLGVCNDVIARTLREFRAPKYRNQWIATVDGKRYYNDSKATNIDSTIQACRTMRGKTALIVGGYDKGISYAGFFAALPPQVTHIVGCGDNVFEMMQFLPTYHAYTYEVTSNLERAVHLAAAKDVENILFSPTTSSFDRYSGYVERGRHFDRIVKELEDARKTEV